MQGGSGSFDGIIDGFRSMMKDINNIYKEHKTCVELILSESENLLDLIVGNDGLIDGAKKATESLTNMSTDINIKLNEIKGSLDEFNLNIKGVSLETGALMRNFGSLSGETMVLQGNLMGLSGETMVLQGNLGGLSSEMIGTAKLYSTLRGRMNKFYGAIGNAALALNSIQTQNINNNNQVPNGQNINLKIQKLTITATNVVVNGQNQNNNNNNNKPKKEGLLESKSIWDAIMKIGKKVVDMTWGGVKKVDESVRPLNRSLGMGAEGMHHLQRSMVRAARSTALFGKSIDELAKMQQTIFSETGRNQLMSYRETKAIAAIDTITGDGGKFVADMDKIGMSFSTSIQYFKDSRDKAGDIGVDAVKHAQLIQSNIQKAQAYSFKQGVTSLSRMAAEALRMRMDIGQTFAFMETNRTLEGSIEASARTQVLGGAFAQISNPMENLYDAWFDPEAAQKKLINLGKKLMTFNEKEGIANFKTNVDRMMAMEYAKANNLDFEKMTETWTRSANLKYVDAELEKNKGNLSEKHKELVRTKGNYGDLEDGGKGWRMAVYDKVTGEYINKAIKDLTAEDIKEQEKTTDNRLHDIAMSTVGIETQLEGLQESASMALAETFIQTGALEVLRKATIEAGKAISPSDDWGYVDFFKSTWKNTKDVVKESEGFWDGTKKVASFLKDSTISSWHDLWGNEKKSEEVGKRSEIGGRVWKDYESRKEEVAKIATSNYDGEFTTKVVSPSGTVHKFHKDDNILAARPNDIVSQIAQTSFLKGIGVDTTKKESASFKVNNAATMRGVNINQQKPQIINTNQPQNIKHEHVISGNLTLTDPSGKSRNWDELIKNPQFVSALTDKIAVQMTSNIGQGRTVGKSGLLYGGYKSGMFG